jgi:hypothetical protein
MYSICGNQAAMTKEDAEVAGQTLQEAANRGNPLKGGIEREQCKVRG